MLISPPAARLLVLVPEGDWPVVELAQRIWSLAAAAGAAVLLVGLADRPEREPQARRALALLQTHTRFDPVPVSTRIARVPDWIAAVKQLRRPGDCVVCFPTQEAPADGWGWRYQPLSRALEVQLKVPAYIVTDVPVPAERRTSRLREATWWGFSLVLIVAFLALQIWLQAFDPGGAGATLLVVSVIAEFLLLGRLNRWRLRE